MTNGAPLPRPNGTAQKILWTLFGLAMMVILGLVAGWASSVEKRIESLSGIVERRVEKVAEQGAATAAEQQRRGTRIERLEEEMRLARQERQALREMIQALQALRR